MADSMKEALSSGITLEPDVPANATDQGQQTAKEVAPVSTETKEVAKPQDGSPANTSATNEDALPFHKHPKFTQALKDAKESSRRYAELERKYQEQQSFIDGLRTGQPKPQEATLPAEQLQAAEQLLEILSKTPGFKEKFGLNQLTELSQTSQEIQMARAQEAHGRELSQVLAEAESLGLDKNEVQERLTEMSQNDPFYSEQAYRPGLIQKMFRDAYWTQMDELAQRKVNRQLIQEQEAKRKANGEGIATTGARNQGRTMERGVERFVENRIREEGGLIV